MRVVFLGTPEPAAVALETLLASTHEVVAVVTQPDRPQGRGRAVAPPPVKEIALARGLEVHQPETPNTAEFVAWLRERAPQALAVVAYGHILKPDLLAVAPAVNVHFSLLPRYRGAAPVQRALMDGVAETGVTTFLLEPTVDTGPALMAEAVEVGPEETAGELLARLAPVGARLLVASLDVLQSGTAAGVPQDSALACPAPKIKPEETRIRWEDPAARIANLVRALNPSPGAWSTFRGKRLNIWRARAVPGDAAPGEVGPGAFAVGSGEGSVLLVEVQPEGKRRMSGEDFARGYRPAPGECLE